MTVTKELALLQLGDAERASKMVKIVLVGERGEDRHAVLAAIKEQPALALALLQDDPGKIGVTERGAADFLDEVVGVVGDDEAAGELLVSHLSTERLAELLEARGDLPSVAALLAPFETLWQAAMSDISFVAEAESRDEDRFIEALFRVQSWAEKFHARGDEDYGRFLERTIGGYPIKDLLAYNFWLLHGQPETQHMDDILRGEFELAGIHSDEAIAAVRALKGNLGFTADDVLSAREAYTEAREERERNAPKLTDPESAAKEAADKITL